MHLVPQTDYRYYHLCTKPLSHVVQDGSSHPDCMGELTDCKNIVLSVFVTLELIRTVTEQA